MYSYHSSYLTQTSMFTYKHRFMHFFQKLFLLPLLLLVLPELKAQECPEVRVPKTIYMIEGAIETLIVQAEPEGGQWWVEKKNGKRQLLDKGKWKKFNKVKTGSYRLIYTTGFGRCEQQAIVEVIVGYKSVAAKRAPSTSGTRTAKPMSVSTGSPIQNPEFCNLYSPYSQFTYAATLPSDSNTNRTRAFWSSDFAGNSYIGTATRLAGVGYDITWLKGRPLEPVYLHVEQLAPISFNVVSTTTSFISPLPWINSAGSIAAEISLCGPSTGITSTQGADGADINGLNWSYFWQKLVSGSWTAVSGSGAGLGSAQAGSTYRRGVRFTVPGCSSIAERTLYSNSVTMPASGGSGSPELLTISGEVLPPTAQSATMHLATVSGDISTSLFAKKWQYKRGNGPWVVVNNASASYSLTHNFASGSSETYSFQRIIERGACPTVYSNEVTLTVTVPVQCPSFTPAIGSPSSTCPGTISFGNATGGATNGVNWNWTIYNSSGYNIIANSSSNTLSYNFAEGIYIIELTGSCGGAWKSTRLTLTVTDPSCPNSLSGPGSASSGASYTLTGSSCSGGSYQWQVKGGTYGSSWSTVGSGQNDQNYTGSYSNTSGSAVTLNYRRRLTDNCGNSSYAYADVTVNPVPPPPTGPGPYTPAITGSGSGCTGNYYSYSNNSSGDLSGVSWQWQVRNSSGSLLYSSTNSSISYNFTSAGSYTVRLIGTRSGSSQSADRTVAISQALTTPLVSISPTSPVAGENVTFSASTHVSGASYSWVINGSSYSGSSVTRSFSAAGTYSYSVTASKNGCSATKNGSITVQAAASPYPTACFSVSSPCNQRTSLNFSCSSGGSSGISYMALDMGDGTQYNGSYGWLSHQYAQTGRSYTISMTLYSNNGNSDSFSQQVYVPKTAQAYLSGPDTVCVGQTAIFTNNSSGANYYYWNFGDGSGNSYMSLPNSRSHVFTQAGTYTVSLSAHNNDCSSTDSYSVVVRDSINYYAGDSHQIAPQTPTWDLNAQQATPAGGQWQVRVHGDETYALRPVEDTEVDLLALWQDYGNNRVGATFYYGALESSLCAEADSFSLTISGTLPCYTDSLYDEVHGAEQNHIRSYTARQAGLTDLRATSLTAEQVSISTTYYDGLGRPVQQVAHRAAPDQSDVVQIMQYDGYGRQQRNYLPYPSAAGSGSGENGFRPDALQQQKDFWESPGTDEIASTCYPFSQQFFEASPLNRVLHQAAQGQDWVGRALETDGSGPGAVSTAYLLYENADSVLRYITDENGYPMPDPAADGNKWFITTTAQDAVGTDENGVPIVESYQRSPLRKQQTTDEEGTITQTYVNGLGQTLLKRVIAAAAHRPLGGAAPADPIITDTYYIYDVRGQLTYVLPPLAVEVIKANNYSYMASLHDQLCFAYRYDGRGRLIAKKVPDTGEASATAASVQRGEVHMVYDKADRLVFSQDAEQRKRSEWLASYYDVLGRVAATALWQSSLSRDSLATLIDAEAGNGVLSATNQGEALPETLELSSFGQSSEQATERIVLLPGYSNNGVAVTLAITTPQYQNLPAEHGYYNGWSFIEAEHLNLLTLSYYDNYDIDRDGTADFAYSRPAELPAAVPQAFAQLQGLPTVSKVRDLETQAWLTTTTFYDSYYRPVQLSTDNGMGGQNTTTHVYDFTGQLLESYEQHSTPQAPAAGSLYTATDYDHAGRVLKVQQGTTAQTAEPVAAMRYNRIGELVEKQLADNFESIAYRYNIRGWLTKVNELTPPSETVEKLFAFRLSYNEGPTDTYSYLNGNIGTQQWQSVTDGHTRGYNYAYDGLNRLLSASYHSSAAEPENYSSSYSYDVNGNITALERYGLQAAVSAPEADRQWGVVDDLSYRYATASGSTVTSSNRLLEVSDHYTGSQAASYFTDKAAANSQPDYAYNANGSLTADVQKDITAIGYNHLNLPAEITLTNGRSILYGYDAAGVKLRKRVLENGQVVSRTDYAGSWVYEQDSLAFVHAAEGRLVPDAQSGQLEREYFYSDHLGNLRLVWKKGEELLHLTAETTADAEEQPQVVQELDDLRTTEQMYEGDAALLLAPQAELQGAGQLAVGEATAVLHFSLQAKAGADPNAPEMSGLRVQEEPSFSFGQELVRVNPVDALAGAADGNGRLDQVSFNLPAILKAAGSLGRKSKRNNYLQGAQGNRFQPVEEPVFSTLRTTESVEGCQPGSIVVLLTGYDTAGAVIATKEQLLPTACQWQPGVFRLPLREIGEGVYFISWRITNSGPSEVYLDELQLQTVEVVQENHYYAFGLDMAGVSKTAANSHSYTYNGKELEAETGWHDYGARMYDSQISRWGAVDPLSDQMRRFSTYNYAFNNPIRFIDPDGMAPNDHIFLNKEGEEISRIVNDEPDRFFVEISTCKSCGDYMEVNSPETVKGDLKDQNAWNGTVEERELGVMQNEINESSEILHEEYYSSNHAVVVESQRGGELDYVDDFKDGTIYIIDGVGYNSHESLNFKWGMAMKKLGFPESASILGANLYHLGAWTTDQQLPKEQQRYTRAGPINEKNHNKSISRGWNLGASFWSN